MNVHIFQEIYRGKRENLIIILEYLLLDFIMLDFFHLVQNFVKTGHLYSLDRRQSFQSYEI